MFYLIVGGSGSCGQHNLPPAGQTSEELFITGFSFKPRDETAGAWAYGTDRWDRNRYTLKGSKYFITATILECPLYLGEHYNKNEQ